MNEAQRSEEGVRSRRRLLTGGALVAGAAAGGALLAATPTGQAHAADGKPLLVGRFNDAYAKTNLAMSANAPALVVEHLGTNRALQAVSRGNGVPTVEVYAQRGSSSAKPVGLRAIAGNVQQKWRDLLTKVGGAVQVSVDRGTAIHGVAGIAGAGVRGDGWNEGPGVLGVSHPTNPAYAGVEGEGAKGGLFRGRGAGSVGLYAEADQQAPRSIALGTRGDAEVWGNLTARGASAIVDDPAQPGEPERMMLHPFVESPERRSLHDGVVTANASGEATVQLPVWFEGLNKEVRYQLTAIGKAAPNLHVKAEVESNAFRIGGANAGQRVSWQLTGLRRG